MQPIWGVVKYSAFRAIDTSLPDDDHILRVCLEAEDWFLILPIPELADGRQDQMDLDICYAEAPQILTCQNDWETGNIILTGTGDADSTIEILLNGQPYVGPQLETICDEHGHWEFPIAELVDGEYALRAMATDAAGNASPQSEAYRFVVDHCLPVLEELPDEEVSLVLGGVEYGFAAEIRDEGGQENPPANDRQSLWCSKGLRSYSSQ